MDEQKAHLEGENEIKGKDIKVNKDIKKTKRINENGIRYNQKSTYPG
jgi:hypothetical protein